MADARSRGPVGEAIDERMERIRPPSYSFDDLIRRRARKQRNARVMSAVVALALAVAVLFALRGLGGLGASERVPASPIIGRSNASRLQLAWTASSPWPVYTRAAVGDGRVFASFADATMRVFPTSCGRAPCRPLWSASTIATSLSPPTVDDGIVYVASGATTGPAGLFAYGADCGTGGSTCRPLWTGVVPPDVQPRYVDDVAPLVTADVVVIVASSRPAPTDELIAYPLACAAPRCLPTWIAPLGPPMAGPVGRPSSLATDGTTVFAAAGADLEAFGTACASNGRLCRPLWVDRLPAPIQEPPALVGGIVYVGTSGGVYGFPSVCPAASCHAVRSISLDSGTGDGISSFAVTGNLVVAGHVNGGIVAEPVGCRTDSPGGCRPVWMGETGPSPTVTVGDGLIFVGAADGVYVFDPKCGSGGAVCRPLWSERIKDATVTVARTGVYVGSSDGRLAAFTVAAR